MGTTTEVVPVVRVDGAPIGTGRPGPIARRLHGAYEAAVQAWLADESSGSVPHRRRSGGLNERPEETGDDPFLAHFHREPLPGGGVRIILVTEQPEEAAASNLAPIVAWLEAAGRPVEMRIVVFDRRTGRLGRRRSGRPSRGPSTRWC